MTKENKKIRVRFAPSPTGFLTTGGARTALFNYLFARHHNGKMILRIEDTDRVRSTPEATRMVLDSLKWLGLDWDEGPFYQSRRLDIYKKYAQKLLDEGKAFYEEDPAKGKAVVFRIKENTKIVFKDLIHGNISFDSDNIGRDGYVVLMKSDGFPTYNFACAIDDSEMGITHVIRGDDHISNTPKQVALYEALGKPVPLFAHIPLILGQDGSKLSKRHGHNYVMEYKDQGFLAESVFNFLSLLGWAPGDDTELMSPDEIVRRFTMERVSHTPAKFDFAKLTWMNNQYLKKMEPAGLFALAKPFFEKAGYDLKSVPEKELMKLMELYRERAKTLSELTEATGFFFTPELNYDQKSVEKFLKKDGSKEILSAVRDGLKNMSDLNQETLEGFLRDLTKQKNLKFKDVAQPIRVALTGTCVSPGIFETIELVGKEKAITRIEEAIKIISSST